MPNKTNMLGLTYIIKIITLTGKLPLAGVLDSEAASGFLLCGGFCIGGY